MTIELTVAISIACTIIGGIVGVAGYRRNSRKDVADEAKSDGVILTEIGYIKSGVDDIKRKQDKQDEQHSKIVERMAKVEASATQAHKRIDRIEWKQYE